MSIDVHIAVLAAGKGTRMKSVRPKVLHHVAGRPMIDYVLETARTLSPRSITVVVGHQADVVQAAIENVADVRTVVQEPQLGTGHALLQTESALAGARGTLILLSGDVPMLEAATLRALLAHHAATNAAATVLTAVVDDPSGYGRIVRAEDGGIARIVEDKDATPAEREINEINSGIYAFELDGLFDAIRRIGTENAQREYYLPDLVAIFRRAGCPVAALIAEHAHEVLGINSRDDLAVVSRTMRDRKTRELMAAGVTIEDPATTYVDRDVTVGADTILHPGVTLEGSTTIGRGCEIHSGVRIVSSHIGDDTIVLDHCVIVEARVGNGSRIGPFAHLRKDSDVRDRARVGNFVELKNTVLGPGSKAPHLTYLGDARIGENVNIGAGTITCNYDGEQKRQTTIEDGAFVGSDSQLIAPITIGRQAYVGSGSTIREDVPAGALAVSAGKQRNIDGWVADRQKKRKTSQR